MTNIITDLENIDFKSSAIAFFCPDGDVISINKLENISLHVEYLYAMAQLNEKIKEIFKGIDLKKYLKNPVAFIIELMPMLASKGFSIYNNLNLDTIEPTTEGILFLPEPSHISDSIRENMIKLHDKLSEINFSDIGFYDSASNFFTSGNNDNNLEELFSIIKQNNDETKKCKN